MAKKQKKLDDITKKFGDEREKALNDALKLIEKTLVKDPSCVWVNVQSKKYKS